MTIRTYDKNGNCNNVSWHNVKKIRIMAIPGVCWSDTLIELHMTLDDDQEVEWYLSKDERFAVIEEG